MFVIALFLALATPAQAALQVGIGDQQPAAYSDARLRAFGLPAARMIVPYDAATSQPAAYPGSTDTSTTTSTSTSSTTATTSRSKARRHARRARAART